MKGVSSSHHYQQATPAGYREICDYARLATVPYGCTAYSLPLGGQKIAVAFPVAWLIMRAQVVFMRSIHTYSSRISRKLFTAFPY